MTIATTTNRIQYTGNGVTVNFAIGSPPFLFYSNSDIVVTATNLTTGVDTPWVLGTNYTITSSGNAQDGFTGTVVATVAPDSNTRITIERVVPYTQQTDYRDGSDSPANTFERSVDYLTMQTQQLNTANALTVKFPSTFAGAVPPMPPTVTGDRYLKTNTAGTAFELAELVASGTITVPVPVAQGGTGATTAGGALTNLGVTYPVPTSGIVNEAVTNAKLAHMAANTVKVRAAATTGNPSDLAIGLNQLVGRGSTGDMAGISLGPTMTMTGTTLNASGGKVVQTAYQEYTTWTTTTNNISYSDTVPTNTQGFEVLSLSYTPLSASNFIFIEVVVNATGTSGGRAAAALFDDGTNAIAAAGCSGNSSQMMTIVINKRVNAGSTSARTYSVRAGETTGALAINGTGGNRIYGGVAACTIKITEVAP